MTTATATPTTAKGRPLDPALGDEIRAAAAELLTERGYGRLSMAAVAKRAGVSTATLYRRWGSKRDLFLSVATGIAEDALPDPDTGTLYGDLTALMERRLEAWSGDRARTLFSLLGEAAHDDELGGIVHQGLFGVTRELLHHIFDRAEQRGELEPHARRDSAMLMFFGAQLVYSGAPLVGTDIELPPVRAAAHQLIETLLLGMTPRP